MTTAAARQEVAKPKKGRAKRPGKKRQAQVTLPQGEWGPDTTKGSRQMENAEIIPMHGKGGDWFFKRRLHTLEWMARSQGPRKPAHISPRQRNAGMEYWSRYARTQTGSGPSWNKVYVDASRKPGNVDVKQLEAQAEFSRLESVIPEHLRYLARFVCCFDRPLSEWSTDKAQVEQAKADLREALNSLADALSY